VGFCSTGILPVGSSDTGWKPVPLRAKEFVVDRTARSETARSPSQKLPPTAIYCHFVAAKPLSPFQPFHSFVAPRGVPASLGPGLRTVSGAVSSLGAMLSPRASLSDDRRIRQQSENAARRRDRRGYGRQEVGVEQRGAGTDRLLLGRGARPWARKTNTVVGGKTRTFTAAKCRYVQSGSMPSFTGAASFVKITE
jgi:hypothetical protein